MITPDKWKWYGSAGHLCVGAWCRFHLCTKVGKYLVSTVGDYHPIRSMREKGEHSEPSEIGCDRLYETMVFKAGAPCKTNECDCGIPEIDGHELDMRGYNNRGDAQRGHYAMCEKWAQCDGQPQNGDEHETTD